MDITKHSRPRPGLHRLYIFGAGGSGREIAWLAQQTWGNSVEIKFLVDRAKYLSEPVNGITVELLSSSSPTGDSRSVIALGDPVSRRKAAEECDIAGHVSTTIIHPRTEISPWVTIGPGTTIAAGVIVTTNVSIGAHVQINIGCTISHDVTIGDFSTLSPGVRIAGHVSIADEVFIGANACIINGTATQPLVIGKGAIIAAGACVTGPVEPQSLVAGVPATRKR